VPLQISEVKQIAGRAGRYRTAHQAISQDRVETSALAAAADPAIGLDNTPEKEPEEKTVGYVTTLDRVDFNELKKMMEQEADTIKTAGLFPPSLIVERFANYFPPGTPFSYVMLRLNEISNIHPRFHLCALKDSLAIADAIHSVRNLSIQDRITLCSAPMNTKEMREKDFMKELALCIAENKSGELLDLEHLPLEVLDDQPTKDREYLVNLEQLHKMLVLYLWLSFRFPNVFTSRKLCSHVTKITEAAIERTLSKLSNMDDYRAKQAKRRLEALQELDSQGADGAGGEAELAADADATREMPRTVQDVLKDTRSFSTDAAIAPDDMHAYPTLETGDIVEEREESSEDTESPKQTDNEGKAAGSRLHNSAKTEAPLHIDFEPNQRRTTQPGL